LAALLDAPQGRERRRVHLRGELAALERERATAQRGANGEHVLDELRSHLSDWQALLRQETGPARRALPSLLIGRLVFTPHERDGEEGFYSFEGEGTVTPIITGATASQGVWWPQRDSNPCFSHVTFSPSLTAACNTPTPWKWPATQTRTVFRSEEDLASRIEQRFESRRQHPAGRSPRAHHFGVP
jgi:hypothetical protein